MQQTGQVAGGSVYTSPHPAGSFLHESVPPYTAAPPYYASPPPRDTAYQNSTASGPVYTPLAPPYSAPDSPVPQAPPYAPHAPLAEFPAPHAPSYAPAGQLHPANSFGSQASLTASLTDSLAGLNISTQGHYPPQNAYAPSVPSYEHSFTAQTSTVPSTTTSSQFSGYPHSGQSFTHEFDSSYGVPSMAGAQAYGTNQQGLQPYGYSPNASQAKVGDFDQGNDFTSNYYRPEYDRGPVFEQSYYEKLVDQDHTRSGYNKEDSGLGEVFAYDGGNPEPYGARGTGSSSWGDGHFENERFSPYGEVQTTKFPKAVPKVEGDDYATGAQKYRVKLLSDSSSTSGPMDVLCQVGLDGVRMINPSTNKTVRIYPLETIARWEVSEPSIFTFWAQSPVDVEARRIRLQSGSYTTSSILDTLTAACVQFSEMVDKDMHGDLSKVPGDSVKGSEDVAGKKKPSFMDWMNLRNKQIAAEEKEHWVPDEAVAKCSACSSDFGPFLRRHHCRNCGDIFCDKCTHGRIALTEDEDAPVVRVCDRCLAEVTQRLSNAKELRAKPPAPRSHEDLAKKLQDLERNVTRRPASSSSSSDMNKNSEQTSVLTCSTCGSISLVSGSTAQCPACGTNLGPRPERSPSSKVSSLTSATMVGKQMREVACPTCTVHLQVEVPSSGTETVECGVCQHPFLVTAH